MQDSSNIMLAFSRQHFQVLLEQQLEIRQLGRETPNQFHVI